MSSVTQARKSNSPETDRADGSSLCGGLPAVLLFTLAYLAVAMGVSWRRGNSEFVMYVGAVAALVALLGLVHWRVRLTLGALWGLSLWGLLHMLGGLALIPASWPNNADAGRAAVLYNWWLIPNALKYDQVVHAFGFAVTTWVCWQGLRAAVAGARGVVTPAVRPTAGMMVLSAAAGMGFGALNEVLEFAATLLLPETNVGGYVNTGWDLVSNAVGAAFAATLIYLTQRATLPTQDPAGRGAAPGAP